jgi:Mrp family chromosome partitioning ATPase
MVAGADVFAASAGGAQAMAQQFGVPYLGHIPLDPNLLKACEEGRYVT